MRVYTKKRTPADRGVDAIFHVERIHSGTVTVDLSQDGDAVLADYNRQCRCTAVLVDMDAWPAWAAGLRRRGRR